MTHNALLWLTPQRFDNLLTVRSSRELRSNQGFTEFLCFDEVQGNGRIFKGGRNAVSEIGQHPRMSQNPYGLIETTGSPHGVAQLSIKKIKCHMVDAEPAQAGNQGRASPRSTPL